MSLQCAERIDKGGFARAESACEKNLDEAASAAGADVQRMFAEAYSYLKRIARKERNRSSGATLNTTGLVHETFVKMSIGEGPDFLGSPQFLAYAAKAMRHVLLDRALRRSRFKMGGGAVHVDIFESTAAANVGIDPGDALALDSALNALEKSDARAARVVELHYFGGLDLDAVAAVIGTSRRTVDRDWRYARAYLGAQMAS